MDWQTLLNRERLGKPLHSPQELGRSPFHKDHDRIIFSGAFRRLGRKTQVHPVTSNDHIHTRLTHSLEVSCGPLAGYARRRNTAQCAAAMVRSE